MSKERLVGVRKDGKLDERTTFARVVYYIRKSFKDDDDKFKENLREAFKLIDEQIKDLMTRLEDKD